LAQGSYIHVGEDERLQVVGEATDGNEAVQKAQELNPDLVLLDIGLLVLNGVEVSHRIAELVPRMRILFLTQEKNLDIANTVLSDGAQGYVLKMDAGLELMPAVDAVLRGEKFVSRSLGRKPYAKV